MFRSCFNYAFLLPVDDAYRGGSTTPNLVKVFASSAHLAVPEVFELPKFTSAVPPCPPAVIVPAVIATKKRGFEVPAVEAAKLPRTSSVADFASIFAFAATASSAPRKKTFSPIHFVPDITTDLSADLAACRLAPGNAVSLPVTVSPVTTKGVKKTSVSPAPKSPDRAQRLSEIRKRAVLKRQRDPITGQLMPKMVLHAANKE